MKYRPDIDGLRAVAVVFVVLYHAFPDLAPGGFVGVDIFFVISGYLITGILLSDLESGRFSILRFYNRRIRRIFPALILVLAATVCIGWFLLFRPEFWTLGKHVAASTLFVENFVLWSESGYFDGDSIKKPLLHLWSLAIEEQFYIVWPILLWAAWRLRIGVLALASVLSLASLLVSVHDVSANPTAGYYSPLSRSWELLLGAGFAVVQGRASELLARYREARSVAGAALVAASLFLINDERAFPGLWALLPTVGTLLLISAGADCRINRLVLSSRPFVFVGLISYPFYLWHWPVFSYAYIAHGPSSVPQMLVLIAFAAMLAVLTYLLWEKPFRFGPRKAFQPLVLLGGMCGVLAVGASILALRIDPRLFRFEVPTRHEWQFLTEGVGFYRYQEDRPALALFIGDSHVAQYAERVSATVSRNSAGLGAVLAIGGGCIPVENVFTDDVSRDECWALRSDALAMARDDRVERVLLGASWNWYFLASEYEYRGPDGSLPLKTEAGRKAVLDQLERQIKELVASGKTVFLMIGNPVNWAFDPFSAGQRLYGSAAVTADFASRNVALDPAEAAIRSELLALAERSGAAAIDPYPALCDADSCRTSDDGFPIFRDSSHFNPDWAIAHATFIDPVTAATATQ